MMRIVAAAALALSLSLLSGCTEPCTPESDGELCAANARECGPATLKDRCGADRTVTCGTCGTATCDAAGKCAGCTETDGAFCARLQRACGPLAGLDKCGDSRSVPECGPCIGGQSCTSAGQCQQGCADTDAAFCARQGIQCGPAAGRDACGASRTVAECGPCTNGASCNSGNCGACVAETPAQYCARLQKDCGTLNGEERCGNLIAAACGTCGAGQSCSSNVCVASARPPHDTCAGAKLLEFDASGKAHDAVDLRQATDDDMGTSCGADAGDVVYKLVLAEPKSLKAVLVPLTEMDVTLNLRQDVCEPTGAELVCVDQNLEWWQETLTRTLQAGTYYLWAGAWSGPALGAFTLDVQLFPPQPVPENDTCATATLLDVSSGSATVSGTTDWANPDTVAADQAMCYGADNDVVYKFVTTDVRDVTAKLTFSDPAVGPSIYLRGGCDPASERYCDGNPMGGPLSIVQRALPAGTWYVFVDSVAGGRGAYTLEVTAKPQAQPPANENCTSPQTLAVGTTLQGDTSRAANDAGADGFSQACHADVLLTLEGPDTVYAFTPAQAGTYVITVTPESTFNTSVWVSTTCGVQASCVVAKDDGLSGEAEVLTLQAQAGVTYYVVVDSWAAHVSGAYSISVAQ